jgi:hypothetical protein
MAASATAGGIVPEAILVNGSVQFSFTHSPSQPNIVDGNAGTASNAIRHLRQLLKRLTYVVLLYTEDPVPLGRLSPWLLQVFYDIYLPSCQVSIAS